MLNCDRRTKTIGILLLILAAAMAAVMFGMPVYAEDAPDTVLDIRDDPAGGKKVAATLRIAAPPDAVRAVLSDYERWPDLFDGRFRMAKLERLNGRVVTDLLITRWPWPGEMRLLCETRELPGGDILTSLIEGNFKRYRRHWRFIPEPNGRAVHTRAELEMLVDIDSWVPDWLFATMLRRDLEAHFKILRDRAVARAGGR
jgi:ribosome-associated toxin RatA of RatAB toxin-antitoxin module